MQQRRQIDAFRFPMVDRLLGFQHIRAADHLFDRAEAKLRHDLAQFLRDE